MSLKDIWVEIMGKNKNITYAKLLSFLNGEGILPFAVDDKERPYYLVVNLQKAVVMDNGKLGIDETQFVTADNVLIMPYDEKRLREVEARIEATSSIVEDPQDKASLFSRFLK